MLYYLSVDFRQLGPGIFSNQFFCKFDALTIFLCIKHSCTVRITSWSLHKCLILELCDEPTCMRITGPCSLGLIIHRLTILFYEIIFLLVVALFSITSVFTCEPERKHENLCLAACPVHCTAANIIIYVNVKEITQLLFVCSQWNRALPPSPIPPTSRWAK